MAPPHRFSDPREARAWRDLLGRWGGLTFRPDAPLVAAARACGVLLRSLDLVARHAPCLARTWLTRLGPQRPLSTLARLATGRLRLGGLAVVSHHFMGRRELATPRGRERVRACVFRAVHDGELMSMCEMNAGGLREQLYERLFAERDTAATRRSTAAPAVEV